MIFWQDLLKFIRSISRCVLRPKDEAYIRFFLKQDVPWDVLLPLAEMEGVSGLLYRHLKDSRHLPKRIRHKLEAVYTDTRYTSRKILGNAARISEQLGNKGVSVMALQGLPLLNLYEDPGLRHLGDMDILVKPAELARFKDLVQVLGFRLSDPVYPNLFYKDELWLDIHTHVLNLDRIHTRKHLFPTDLTSLWNRAIPLFPDSSGLLQPEPIDNIILMAAHALKHSYTRTIWLVDLYEMLRRYTRTDHGWHRVIERAEFWRQGKVLLYGLIILEGTLGFRVPLEVKTTLGARRLGVFEKYLLRIKLKGFSSGEYGVLLSLFTIRGIAARLRFLRETLFPKPEIMDQIYIQEMNKRQIFKVLNRVLQAAEMLRRNAYQALRIAIR